jgi:hypothetical protein
MLPRTAEQLTDNIPSRHNSRKACPRESGGGNPVSCNRVWIPGLRSAPPGMTVLIHRQTNRASQPTPLPPASPNATDRTDHTPDPAVPNKHPPPSVAPKRTSPQGQQRCCMAGTRPAHDDRPFGISKRIHRPAGNRSCQPIPTSQSPPANPGNPASRPRADPIRAQFGPADSRHCHASPTGLAPD